MTRKIVITGASSQIGQAIARKVVMPGDSVLLHGVRHIDACPKFSDPSIRVEVKTADFCDPEQLAAFCHALKDVDILINAAASTQTDLLPNLDSSAIETMLAVNIRALVAICQNVIPAMMIKRHGVIINLSSIAAQRGNKGQSVYAGTKGFVESFTRSLAAEYGARGIRVNAVSPGAIDAGNLKNLLAYAEHEVKQSTALKKLGKPEDVASLVAFLCSDEAQYISGKCIAVDGGFCQGV